MAYIFRLAWSKKFEGIRVNFEPGDTLPDDHPDLDWLVKSTIVIKSDSKDKQAEVTAKEDYEETPTLAHIEADSSETGAADEHKVQEEAPVPRDKPKRSDKIEAWQAWWRSHGADPTGKTLVELKAAEF